MHATLIELMQTTACTFAFALVLLPCGFLAAYAANIHNFREQTKAEQILWTLALSLPISIVLAELLGRIASPTLVEVFFAALLLTAILIANGKTNPAGATRESRIINIAALTLSAYLIFTLIDIQVGNKLFVPTTFTDWGVRAPLTWSAMRGPVPPLNPLSALDGHPAPLRYYYFWYVLCALPARLVHAQPNTALAASSVWAGLALLATTFLCLKYFVRDELPLRRRCVQVLLPMLVIGLDILPTLGTYLHRGSNPYLDIEWWHSDRSPALLTGLVYAPHHIAGLVCCFAAFLVLAATTQSASASKRFTLRTQIAAAILAGIAFAACVGTSTFIALIFVFASLFWAVDLLRTKQWPTLYALAGSGAMAYIISRVYLHELKSTSSAAHGLFAFAWRSNAYVSLSFNRHAFFANHHAIAFLTKQPFILALDFCELGFFAFVLAHQLRHQLFPALRGERQLTAAERALWSVFFATALTWLFLSSEVATLSGNDLGGHAGMLLRFILILWSPNYLHYLREQFLITHKRSLTSRLAILCFALGLAGGLFDAAWHRIYVPLFDAHVVARPAGDFAEPDHLSERLLDIRTIWRQLDTQLPPDAVVQSNLLGKMRIATTRYSLRQLAASDDGCGTAFGGNLAACTPVRAMLRHLYDEEDQHINLAGQDIPAIPESIATVDDFRAACRSLHLAAILVDQTDRVWNQSGSWVWNMQPIAAAPTIRAYPCPTL